MYEELKALLNAIEGIQFAEYEWATRPAGNHGVYQLEFDADSDTGDDGHVDRAMEGSVEIWTQGHCGLIAAAVESALETVCEGSWELNDMGVDHAVGMLRREYVFQMEAV